MSRFHLGLIINPLAGLGGPAGLKGSDGVAEQALALGSQPLAAARTRTALECLRAVQERLEFLTFPGTMGADLLAEMGFSYRVLGELQDRLSSAADTRMAVEQLQDAGGALVWRADRAARGRLYAAGQAGRGGVRRTGAQRSGRLAAGQLGSGCALHLRSRLDPAWPGTESRPDNHFARRRCDRERPGDRPRCHRSA